MSEGGTSTLTQIESHIPGHVLQNNNQESNGIGPVNGLNSEHAETKSSPQHGAVVVGSNPVVEVTGQQPQQQPETLTLKEKFKKYFFIILAGVSCIIGNMFVGFGALLLAAIALPLKDRKIALALNLLSVFVSICAFIVTAVLIFVVDKFLF